MYSASCRWCGLIQPRESVVSRPLNILRVSQSPGLAVASCASTPPDYWRS
jgi:hypothetical protein